MAETDSYTNSEVIHVRLTDEDVLVWRPVEARNLGGLTYLVVDQDIPDFEEWEFQPGTVVKVEAVEQDGNRFLKAVEAVGNQTV